MPSTSSPGRANIHGNNVHLWPFVEEARRNGARLVVIDPYRTRTARVADWHIPIQPGTDTALALGLMRIIIKEGLYDRDYVAQHTHGFEALREHVLAYTPEHVAGLTGIAAADIERLAREYASSAPAVIRLNYGIQRSQNGGSAARAVCMLPALIGAWKQRGGGLQLSTSGAFAFNSAALERPDLMLASPLQRPARIVNMSRLGHALTELDIASGEGALRLQLEPGGNCSQPERGGAGTDAQRPIHRGARAVLHRHYRLRRYRAAGHHLPGTQRLSGSLRSLLSAAVGAGDRPAGRGAVERLAVQPTGPAHGLHRVLLPRQRRRSDRAGAGAGQIARRNWKRRSASACSRHAEQFANGVFATPSGKIEFYSSTLAAQGLDPLPTFHPPDESRRGADAHTFPLEFLPRKADNYMNSTFANLPGHQKMESPGLAMMHASDAGARQIGEADWVEIYNARGKIRLRARIDGSVPAGVVAASLNWNKLSTGGNNVNALTSERLTDLGRGATFYSTLVEVRKLNPEEAQNLFPPID